MDYSEIEQRAFGLLRTVEQLAAAVERHTAESRRSCSYYVRARRCGRSFLRRARAFQSRATAASVKLYTIGRETSELSRQVHQASFGRKPTAQERRILKDLQAVEGILKSWASPPDTAQ